MKNLLIALLMNSAAYAGEVVTIEGGQPVYNVEPVFALSESALTKVEQAEKIKQWLAEVEESFISHGENIAAQAFLSLLNTEIERLEKESAGN